MSCTTTNSPRSTDRCVGMFSDRAVAPLFSMIAFMALGGGSKGSDPLKSFKILGFCRDR